MCKLPLKLTTISPSYEPSSTSKTLLAKLNCTLPSEPSLVFAQLIVDNTYVPPTALNFTDTEVVLADKSNAVLAT